MRMPENPYYNLEISSENPPYGLQVQPVKPLRRLPGNHRSRTHYPKRKRRTRRQQLKYALSASVVILTVAAGSMLYLINAGTDSLGKISSPAFFSDLDASHQQLSTTDDLWQDKNPDTAAIQEGTVHIASFSDDWKLILVNPWNPVPEDYDVNLVQIQNGHSVDARCYPDLQNMLADCINAGLHPLICSSYRTQEKQLELFSERVDELTALGYSIEDAYDKAATSVAKPGTSEHQIGLAVDIVDQYHQVLDTSQESTLVQQWLMENSWRYGFILRYPNGTSDLTGIIYEPWHYRYVGKKAAKEIYKRGICLEEYLAEQL